jgi:clathrin heavy chain
MYVLLYLTSFLTNEADNSLLIKEEDCKTLRDSIDSFDNLRLAKEARSVWILEACCSYLQGESTFVFSVRCRMTPDPMKKKDWWEESISLSKQDKLYKDAMITAAVSGSAGVAILFRPVLFRSNKESRRKRETTNDGQ